MVIKKKEEERWEGKGMEENRKETKEEKKE